MPNYTQRYNTHVYFTGLHRRRFLWLTFTVLSHAGWGHVALYTHALSLDISYFSHSIPMQVTLTRPPAHGVRSDDHALMAHSFYV